MPTNKTTAECPQTEIKYGNYWTTPSQNPMENERTLILAVDGGGSSSQVAIYDVSNDAPTAVLKAETGPLSLKSSDEATVLGNMQALRDVVSQWEDNIAIGVLGLSGLDSPDDYDEIGRLLHAANLVGIELGTTRTSCARSIHSTCGFPIALCSDAVLPLWACGLNEGTVLIAGTGSIALRITDEGDMLRIGGWGYRVSDEGSGCWMGSEFLREALHAAERVLAAGQPTATSSDTTPPHTPSILSDAWLATIESENAAEILPAANIIASDMCLWAMQHDDPKDMARLARSALESTSPEANSIKIAAADALARIASLASGGKGTIVLSGGLFANASFKDLVESRICSIAPNIESIVSPEAPLTLGACKFGRMLLETRK